MEKTIREKKFSAEAAIKFGWDTMKTNIRFFIVFLIAAFLIENLPVIIANIMRENSPVASAAFYLASWVLGFLVQMGFITVGLKFCDGKKAEIDDLLSSFNLLLTFIAGSVVYYLIILGGLVLLIVPGIIWGIKFSLFPYFVVDKGLGPIEALKASGKATEDAKWDLFLFGLLLGLINLIGVLCLLVGLFATLPATLVASAYVYRKLAGNIESIGTKQPEYSI
ncbi:MAG: hypothetical protein HY808_07605 [Nitrospirae bacterium]|nr:hypothetical protein [Nitrospirota bacterium]